MSFQLRRATRRFLLTCAIGTLALPATAMAAAPTTSMEPFVSGWNGNLGDVLTCDPAPWSGATSIEQFWTRDGERVSGASPYTLTMADLRRSVRCVQIATNADGPASAESLAVVWTEPPPAIVSEPTVSGTPIAGRPLTCDGAVFSGINLGAPSYEWTRAGRSGVLGTSQVYVPTEADAGGDIGCRVTVTNPTASTDAHAKYVQVESGLPNIDIIPKVVGKAQPSMVVTCRPGTWTGDGITFSYQWLLQGKPIKGATKSKITVIDAWDEKGLACRVTATNANGSVPFDSHVVSVFTPGILAPLAKVQPKLPKLRVAIRSGVTARLVCNVTCATEATAMMLLTDAQRLGIASRRDKGIGGFFIVGKGYANRTYGGPLLVTTKFTAKAKRGLAKTSAVRIDFLYETSNSKKYAFKHYHVAASRSTTLRR